VSPAPESPLPPSGAAGEEARFGLGQVDLRMLRVPAEILALVPADFALQHRVLPLGWTEGGVLRVAVADPLATEGVDALALRLGCAVESVLAAPADLGEALRRSYENAPAAASGPQAAVAWVDGLLREALDRRASDIHVEPMSGRTQVRYRIDGVLQDGPPVPPPLRLAVGSRLKILAGLSIDEKRVPQDGHLPFSAAGRSVDLRVSTLPSLHGESLALRVLDRADRPAVDTLGLTPDQRRSLGELLARPDGLVLVTGPTGSGKTTTLYACLNHLSGPDRKILTVEDPIESPLTGVNQVMVRPDAGMSFAQALRAMLRQSPNVIMVGEIRDAETAEVALQAALTGHLVFSTLHTEDAPGAVARLADLGLRANLLASALRGVVAQRLVRTVCSHCSVLAGPVAHERRLIARYTDLQAEGWRRGTGCTACNGTGYRGRAGLFEFLSVDETVGAEIAAGPGARRLRACARTLGWRSLREDGIRKAASGLTTLEEIFSVTPDDPS
jgi:general secretion pathway protein E/type IV pilus assembly protein PilB